MTTTTPEQLTIGGIVLNTLGYNIDLWQSQVGAHIREPRYSPIARRPGAFRERAQVMPTELELSMWVSDRDADGVPNGSTQLWTNLDLILAALGTNDLIALSKIRGSSGGNITLTGTAELIGPIEYEQRGTLAVQLNALLMMADPFWYGASSDQNIAGASGSMTNAGHTQARKITITLEAGGAGWTNPSIDNTTTGITLDFTGTVAASKTYVLDFWEGTAIDDLAASISGAVDLSGGNFFELNPGSNSIDITESAGGGTFRCVFNPPYLG